VGATTDPTQQPALVELCRHRDDIDRLAVVQ